MEKCTSDDKFVGNLKFRYDSENQFTNYEGQAALSHYHEAAYDAHMTGVAFMHIIKFKEIQRAKDDRKKKNPKGAGKGPQGQQKNKDN